MQPNSEIERIPEEYFAGFRLNATDSTTLYFAAQYMKNWRTFYYWMPKNEAVKGDSTTAGNQNGVDGWGLNLGFRQNFPGTSHGSVPQATQTQKLEDCSGC